MQPPTVSLTVVICCGFLHSILVAKCYGREPHRVDLFHSNLSTRRRRQQVRDTVLYLVGGKPDADQDENSPKQSE